jgi:hypothetical protein
MRYCNGVYANIEPQELKDIVNTWQVKIQQVKQPK